jgi:hypothetical protein
VVLNPVPFVNHSIRFRMADVNHGECSASECSLLCKDFGSKGYDRFIIVPRVKVAYDLKTWGEIIRRKQLNPVYNSGYPSDKIDEEILEWEPLPEKIACLGMLKKGIQSPDQPWKWEGKDSRDKNASRIQIGSEVLKL